MPESLKHVAVITGAGRRGQLSDTVARTLLARGTALALIARDEAAARDQASALQADGPAVSPFGCDLLDFGAVQAVAGRIAELYPSRVTALVNLAGGFAASGNVAESDPEQWDRVMAGNLRTAYAACRAFLPLMRQAGGGSVVFIASEVVIPGMSVAGISAYATAKGGLYILARAIAEEERENGIRANVLAPGAIRTRANEQTMGSDARYLEREQVADVIAWLLSDQSRAVSGQLIRLS